MSVYRESLKAEWTMYIREGDADSLMDLYASNIDGKYDEENFLMILAENLESVLLWDNYRLSNIATILSKNQEGELYQRVSSTILGRLQNRANGDVIWERPIET
jgi:hypothetical protein